jgi:hypothetical protein
MEIVSWIFYAAAVACLFLVLGLAFVGRKALGFVYGHLGIGFGLAIMCAAGGYKFGNTLTLAQNWIFLTVVAMGYAIFFFGRRRARDEKRFLDAIAAADEKVKAKE